MPLVMVMVATIGAMLGAGCEKQKIDSPQETQTETPVLQTDNPGSFLIGEWAVNASMSEGVDNYYKDTLVFANSGIIEKHSTLSGAQYFVLNDTTIRIENTHGVYDVFFRYFPPDGILLYNFWDNTITESVKNIYYERVRL